MTSLKRVGYCVAGVLVVAAAASPTKANSLNLITNGNFQDGDFTGFTQGGDTRSTFLSSATNGDYIASQSGSPSDSFFALLGPPDTGTLSQTFNTTNGDLYQLSFYLASNGAGPNSFSAAVGGQTAFSATDIAATGGTAPYPYVQHTFDFTATGPTTNLTFSFNDVPSYLALDNISVLDDTLTGSSVVTPLPKPAMAGAALLGVLGLSRLRRRVVTA